MLILLSIEKKLWFLRNRSGTALDHSGLFPSVIFLFPTFQTDIFISRIALFWRQQPLFLRLKLARGSMIAANIGQPEAMVR